MSDLSRQLRYICSKRDFDGKACGKCYYCQAADEIERLTARLSEANGNNHAYKSEIECWKERLDEAQAKVDELETRLKLANDYVESLVAMINK